MVLTGMIMLVMMEMTTATTTTITAMMTSEVVEKRNAIPRSRVSHSKAH